MENLKDLSGIPYSSPDGKQAPSNVAVTIHGPNGPEPGTMIGGHVQRNS